jgi:Uma2 family endonuclease
MIQRSLLAWPETEPESIYPASDGKPMAETTAHVTAIILLLQALEDYFARKRDVFCAADIFWYYEEGQPKKRVAPDILVAKGVVHRPHRRSFFSWREGTVPCVIFEITSKKTRRVDLGPKRDLYERQGVSEYFLFDPEADYLKPPLQGYRLQKGKYAALQSAEDGSLSSEELGLRLVAEGEMLRLVRAKSGRRILTRAEKVEEAERRADREEQRADLAEQRANEREVEVAALKAELERLRKGQP